jgi:hypothetical protein
MPSFPALAPLTLSATSHQAASLDLAVSEPHGLLWPGFNATAPPQHPGDYVEIISTTSSRARLKEVKELHFEEKRVAMGSLASLPLIFNFRQ